MIKQFIRNLLCENVMLQGAGSLLKFYLCAGGCREIGLLICLLLKPFCMKLPLLSGLNLIFILIPLRSSSRTNLSFLNLDTNPVTYNNN
jgi:hypothetical protein